MAQGSVRNFKTQFCDRTKTLRERRGLTQAQVAHALGIEIDRYKKYEQRSPMPHEFVTRFCIVVGAQLDELYEPPRWLISPGSPARVA